MATEIQRGCSRSAMDDGAAAKRRKVEKRLNGNSGHCRFVLEDIFGRETGGEKEEVKSRLKLLFLFLIKN